MQANSITFFQRLREDILAGHKTTTIHDTARSYFKPGDVLRVGHYEGDGYLCTTAVTVTPTVMLDMLAEQHVQQGNMALEQLQQVIREICPTEDWFYVIEFKRL